MKSHVIFYGLLIVGCIALTTDGVQQQAAAGWDVAVGPRPASLTLPPDTGWRAFILGSAHTSAARLGFPYAMMPTSVAVINAGHLVVGDARHHVVWLANMTTKPFALYGRRVGPQRAVVIAGGGGLGSGGDGGTAATAQLVLPAGLALDSAHNLYISDPLTFTVREVNAATGRITTVVSNPTISVPDGR